MKDLFEDFLENEEVGVERDFGGDTYVKMDFRDFEGEINREGLKENEVFDPIDFTTRTVEYIKNNLGQLDILTFVWVKHEGWDVITF